MLPQALEVRSHSTHAHQSHLHLNLAAAREIDRMFASMLKIRIDAHRLPQIGHRPTLRHQESRSIAQKNSSRLQVTSPARRVFVIDRSTTMSGNIQSCGFARIPIRRRQFIVGAHPKIDRRLICHREVYGRSDSNRKRTAPFAPNRELFRTRKPQPISEEHEQQ